MKRYTAMAATGAVALASAGALIVPAVASGSATTHTAKFTAVLQKQAQFSKRSFGETDKNLSHGKIVGFDVINGRVNPNTNRPHGWVAVSTRGGMMFGTLRFTNGPVTRGSITGGTGRFSGATGTIYAKSLNSSGTRTAVVVTYRN
ncbi:MAG TPA: hypothetical protein VI452_13320 [Marmoricola sp.]